MKMPRSEYVRDAIKGLAFTDENRKYIHDLVTIEEFAIRGPRSMAEGMLEAQLRSAYRGAFECILRELNPERHAREVRERAETRQFLRRELKKAAEAAQRELERDREMWSQLGGKLD